MWKIYESTLKWTEKQKRFNLLKRKYFFYEIMLNIVLDKIFYLRCFFYVRYLIYSTHLQLNTFKVRAWDYNRNIPFFIALITDEMWHV